jgi:tetratricopeptide (TPR) repeat protein
MGMIYFTVRMSSAWVIKYFIPILFSAFFLFELYTGIQQIFLNVRQRNNLSLSINGSLQNSGVYSYYLIISLPVFLYTLNIIFRNKTIRKLALFVALLLVLLILYFTKSRTAMLCLAMFAVLLVSYKYKGLTNKITLIAKKNKFIFFFGCAALISCSMFLLIQIKPESFMGRILVWQITLQHVSDNFFTGIGIGNFSFYYPQWQIEYFSSHANPPVSYFLNASETHVAFNELLQILTEFGIIGLLSFVALIIYLLKLKPSENEIFILSLKATILLILFAGLSSYALHCNAIFLLFSFAIAALLSFTITKSSTFNCRGIYQLIILFFFQSLLLFTAFKSMKQYNLILKWATLRDDLFLEPTQIKSGYFVLYPFFKTNGKFLVDMDERLLNIGDQKNAIKILEQSKQFYFSERTLLVLSEAYYEVGNIKMTIKTLEKLSNLIPSKFYPKYNLVKLYYKSGDTLMANRMANIILSMPVKKMSADVNLIRVETRQLLNNKNH